MPVDKTIWRTVHVRRERRFTISEILTMLREHEYVPAHGEINTEVLTNLCSEEQIVCRWTEVFDETGEVEDA